MDSETRRAIRALCEKLGHELEPYLYYKNSTEVAIKRCKICDKLEYMDILE